MHERDCRKRRRSGESHARDCRRSQPGRPILSMALCDGRDQRHADSGEAHAGDEINQAGELCPGGDRRRSAQQDEQFVGQGSAYKSNQDDEERKKQTDDVSPRRRHPGMILPRE